MKIDIIGAGSLGLLLAGKLSAAGNEIRLWCRGIEQCRRLKDKGLTVSYEEQRAPVWVDGSRLEIAVVNEFSGKYMKEPADWIILAVKQKVLHSQLPEVLASLKGHQPRIICFQNGSGHMEMLQRLLPESLLYAAVTTEAAKVVSSHEVIHAGSGQTWIGPWDRNAAVNEESRAISFVENLKSAGFAAYLSNEVKIMIYRKLLINAVINPLTAIWRIPNGELLHTPARLGLMKELFEEATAVYQACGVPFESSIWEDILGVCRATSGNISSMLADVLAARTTEINWINGSIIEMAERSGMAATAHRWVSRMVEGMIAEEG